MEKRPFLAKSNKPTEQAVQVALGEAYTYYERALAIADSYSQTWTFTKSSGWMLKMHDRKKALFYLIPLNDGLKVSLTIRESERDAFLEDDELVALHDAISTSRKYQEGHALRFSICSEEDFQPFELLIRKVIASRT